MNEDHDWNQLEDTWKEILQFRAILRPLLRE